MNANEDEKLLETALRARKRAHAPYSGYSVGAALLCADGTIISGCNVENASYGLSNCAERTALFSARAQGKTDFLKLALVSERASTPCGACRQVMHELSPNLIVIIGDDKGEKVGEKTLAELLPQAFEF